MTHDFVVTRLRLGSHRGLVRKLIRGLSRGGAAAVLTLLACVLWTLPTSAHDTLTGSDPANGSTVKVAPTTISLTFDQPVQNYQPVLTVTGPNGNQFNSGAPTVSSNVVSSKVDGGPAGKYVATYRIVSADGHPVSGEINYTLAAGAAGTARGTPAQPGTSPIAASSNGSSGPGIWLWIAIALAALLVIVAIALILRSASRSDSD